MKMLRLGLAVLAGVALAASAGAANPPNLLILLADDLGVSDVARYGVSTDPVNTPVLDRLAGRGVTFRNAWSNPVCSPTRACIQTGRHAFRTGIGFLVTQHSKALDPSEWTIPEVLAAATPTAYTSATFGKWHLGNSTVGGLSAPTVAGYGHFAGNLTSLIDNLETYSQWTKVVNGVAAPMVTYNTTDIVDDAIAWLATAPEPWICYVAFNAPHVPLHAPPSHLHTENLTGLPAPGIVPRPYFKAMVEAMDTEMGRLVGSLNGRLDHTNIIFAGDNGSPQEVAIPPVLKEQAKISFFEPGIQVPLVVAGPAVRVPGSDCEALVHAVDLFATIAQLGGVDTAAVLPPNHKIDGISLTPYLQDPGRPSLRKFNYTELFGTAVSGVEFSGYAVRDDRWKLVYFRAGPAGTSTQMYDLWNDPNEYQDRLAGPLSTEISDARDRLLRAAAKIRGS